MGGEDADHEYFDGGVDPVDVDQKPMVCKFDRKQGQIYEKHDLDNKVED